LKKFHINQAKITYIIHTMQFSHWKVWMLTVVLLGCVTSAAKQKKLSLLSMHDKLIMEEMKPEEKRSLQSIPLPVHGIILAYLVGSPAHWVYLQTCRAIRAAYTVDTFIAHFHWYHTISTYTLSPTSIYTVDEYVAFYRTMLNLAMYVHIPRLNNRLFLAADASRPILSTDRRNFILLFSHPESMSYPAAEYNVMTGHFSYTHNQRRIITISLPQLIILGHYTTGRVLIEVLPACALLTPHTLTVDRPTGAVETFLLVFLSSSSLRRYHFVYVRQTFSRRFYLQVVTLIHAPTEGRVLHASVYKRNPMGYFKLCPVFSEPFEVIPNPWGIIKLHTMGERVSFYNE